MAFLARLPQLKFSVIMGTIFKESLEKISGKFWEKKIYSYMEEFLPYQEGILQIRKYLNLTINEAQIVGKNIIELGYDMETIIDHCAKSGKLPESLENAISYLRDQYAIEIEVCSFQPQSRDIEV